MKVFDSGKLLGKKHSLFDSGITTLKETTGSSLYEGRRAAEFQNRNVQWIFFIMGVAQIFNFSIPVR